MKPRIRSIVATIAWTHLIVVSIASVVASFSAYFLLRNTALTFEHEVLRRHADTLAAYLHQTGETWHLQLPGDLKTFYAHGFEGFSYAVRDSHGALIDASVRGVSVEHRDMASASPSYFERRHGNTIFFGVVVTKRISGQTIVIEVGQNGANPDVIVDDILVRLFRKVGWPTIAIMLMVIAIDILVVRRALRPVLASSELARAIEPARMDLRLPERDVPIEIRPLVEAFNSALDRLERGFRVQREFTADAAHELRTPLSILRSRIDLLKEDRDAIEPLKQDVDVMARIVGQLLEAAELEVSSVNLGELFDLKTVCAKVVDYMAAIARARSQRFVLTGSAKPVLISGNADMVFRAVRNLAENAAKYSPPGSKIELGVDDDGSVCVIDEGPGVPENERALIFDRFWRRDRHATDGAGLGLSIVSKIVELHGGQIEVQSLAERGAKFILRFTPVAKAQCHGAFSLREELTEPPVRQP